MSQKLESMPESFGGSPLKNILDIKTPEQLSVEKYTRLAQWLKAQIQEINDFKLENTNIAADIGDFIGEKTGAFSTGKSTYESMIARTSQSVRNLHAKILAEFPEWKSIPEWEKQKIATLLAELQTLSGSKLKSVGWADAAMNTTGFKDITAYRYYARMTLWLAEWAYEWVAGIADLTGKVIAQLAVSLDPKARAIVIEDYKKIADAITLENAKKLWDALPQVFAEFKKLPADQQLEWASKLIGMIIVPLGIGAKWVKAGKAIAQAGMNTAKAGVDMTARAAKIAVRQAGRVGGASTHAINVASRSAVAGVASTALGVGGVAVAETGVVAATAVRYVGEMGGGVQKSWVHTSNTIWEVSMNNVMREIKYSEPIRGKLNPNIIEKSQVPFLAAEEVERDLKRLIDVYKLRIPYPISEYFQDYALYNSLRSKFNWSDDEMAKVIKNTSRFDSLVREEGLYWESLTITWFHANWLARSDDIGHRININFVKEHGIDISKVLFFRVTQPWISKPEYYWTTDMREVLSWLTVEIGWNSRSSSVILVASLEDISKNGWLIRDKNDDLGLAVRQIGTSNFDQNNTLFIMYSSLQ